MKPLFDKLFDTIQEKIVANGKVVLIHKVPNSILESEAETKELGLRDALADIMRNAGIEVSTDVEEGQRVLDEANGQAKTMGFAGNREEFNNTLNQAIKENGIVLPNLDKQEVSIVNVPQHDFAGNNPIEKAEAWAKDNIVTKKNDKGNILICQKCVMEQNILLVLMR